MTNRRALCELLAEMADSVVTLAAPAGLRVTSLQVSVPVEVELVSAGSVVEFRAEVPRFVTRTDFDRPLDRLTVNWQEGLQS
jgi:hypothetical protein